ncbi:MAG TPA: YbaB/EbfC family nucleoid-associated protein [Micromonosporaceae bacterium]|jgi:DNA-binding protein YbaB
MAGDDLDAAEAWVDSWQATIQARADRARQLAARWQDLSATGADRDGLVEVTVSSAGALTDIRLDEGVRGQPVADTRRRILEAVGAARDALTRQVTEAVGATIGWDDPAANAIVAAYDRRRRGRTEDGDALEADGAR